MAERSLMSRLASSASADAWRAVRSSQRTHVACPVDRDLPQVPRKAPNVTCSVPDNKLGCRLRAAVFRLPRMETDGFRVDLMDMEDDTLPQVRSVEKNRAVLQGSFETVAAVGRVECNSNGCRPIFEDSPAQVVSPDNWLTKFNSPNVLESRTATYHNRRQRDEELRHKTHFALDFAVFLSEVWMENGAAEKYFEVALQSHPHNPRLLLEYAEFSWRTLGNAEKAEELYSQALQVSPGDANIHASYALFLWQSES